MLIVGCWPRESIGQGGGLPGLVAAPRPVAAISPPEPVEKRHADRAVTADDAATYQVERWFAERDE